MLLSRATAMNKTNASVDGLKYLRKVDGALTVVGF
jgi:hypothetical protein